MQINIHEAKTQLSRLIERAARGEEIIIARAGRPVARLVGLQPGSVRRAPGAWRGKVRIHDDFDELPAEVAAAFAGFQE